MATGTGVGIDTAAQLDLRNIARIDARKTWLSQDDESQYGRECSKPSKEHPSCTLPHFDGRALAFGLSYRSSSGGGT